MEAGDTHVPPPVWGDDSYAAGCGLPPRPPYRRGAVGPRVVAASWKDELEARFALVDRVEEAGPINPHPRVAGPSKTWFYSLQYVFIAYLSLIVTIHMLHCQLKPLILIVYVAYPVGCGCG